jgi:hypothetical protein
VAAARTPAARTPAAAAAAATTRRTRPCMRCCSRWRCATRLCRRATRTTAATCTRCVLRARACGCRPWLTVFGGAACGPAPAALCGSAQRAAHTP